MVQEKQIKTCKIPVLGAERMFDRIWYCFKIFLGSVLSGYSTHCQTKFPHRGAIQERAQELSKHSL